MPVFYRRSDLGGVEKVEEGTPNILLSPDNACLDLADDEPVQRGTHIFKPRGYVKESEAEKPSFFVPTETGLPPDLID